MADPITTGALVAAAASAGAAALANGVLGEAAKDAYDALKNAVVRWTGSGDDLAKVEATPQSEARKSVVAELVDEQSDDAKHDLGQLAKALIAALRSEEQQGGPVGVDIGKLEAMEVDLGRIRVAEGTGVKAEEIKTDGAFHIAEIDVGSSGKG